MFSSEYTHYKSMHKDRNGENEGWLGLENDVEEF